MPTNPFTHPPLRAAEIWQSRPDLQKAFDLNSPEGRSGLVWWYFLHAFREMGFGLTAADNAQFLNEPQPGIRQRSYAPITRLMHELHARRSIVSRPPAKGWVDRRIRRLSKWWRKHIHPLDNVTAQRNLLDWYFTQGLAELNLLDLLTDQQAGVLLDPSAGNDVCPRLLGLIWRADPDLQRRFANPADPEFLEWCRLDGLRTWPILAHPKIGLAAPRSAARKPDRDLPFGVNLFGHARARLGVGEDVRMASLALTEAGVPHIICDVAAGQIQPEEHGFEAHIGNSMPYAINMFCMTGMETVAAMQSLGRGRFEDRINIGFWPWELPEWPKFWHHAYGYIDEVWASSEFAEQAFRNSSPVPVRRMPMAVSVAQTEGLARQDFGLPDGHFLFAFAFDGLSSFHRKNPQGCIAAFQEAFPDRDAPIGLVLKGLRVEDHLQWHDLQSAAQSDPRIHLLTGSYSRGRLLDLFRAIDCFVSLHRSEGFGRNIAEAMALGKPVIATSFSGNTDFTRPDTSFLVPYRPAKLKAGEYPFGDGQEWAEPDITAAAAEMRKVAENPAMRAQIALAGQRLVASLYGPARVGSRYRPVLTALLADSSS